MEEGTTTAVLGIAETTPPFMVPISVVPSSSASSSSLPSSPRSLASASFVPSWKRVRSRKVEKSRVIKKNVELDEGKLPSVVKSGGGRRSQQQWLRKQQERREFLRWMALVDVWLGFRWMFVPQSQVESSAHQMSPLRSSAEGSTQDPWEQASRKSYASLVDGGLLPEGYGDVFVRLAQKARPAPKRIRKRIAAMSPMELGQEPRDAQAASLRADEVRKTATEQLVIASGRVPRKARTRPAMMSFSGPAARQDAERATKKSLASSLGHAPRG